MRIKPQCLSIRIVVVDLLPTSNQTRLSNRLHFFVFCHTFPSPDISVGKPQVHKCLEGRHNNMSFLCPALRHESLSTLWFLGDQISPAEYISVGSEGSRLDVPCLSRYNDTEVWCQVQLRAGIVNKTVGHISLYPG